ncbi:hypothetical protein LNO88_25425 [Klebsiella pneumoniae subsp. pneumoniae]|nr:hypothetical protein [Klebsiella pneumoniae subsp. pneumoniae]MCS5950972.1 hypothetical protein [Klebsiella pneumoniae subsp. pneumoniae]
MIKTTIWRQVVIAALLAGGSFTVAANPPPPPPVSYGVEEDVFHPVRARQGWWPRWTRWRPASAWISCARAVTLSMRR